MNRGNKRGRILLREPELCLECNRVFLSLYSIRSCNDHDGLDEIAGLKPKKEGGTK